MKIEKIRFRNLNSLVGTWVIDLTDAAYSSEGLFAIVGSTGAGKTTILDAVCLALYGCTPRLGGVSSGSNEIMSRHTGECSSEVTFETQKGRFRCSWHQRRARGKSDGNLQPPRHELVDIRTNQILASKKSDVCELVEEKSGLDFDRFTRSVMLAQGNFDAFLKADSGDRSPILEEITGTEIYTDISKAAFDRQREERGQLSAIELRIDDFELLDDEEEANLVEKHRQEQEEAERQRKALLQLDKQIQQKQLVVTLTAKLKELEKKKVELIARKDDFEPRRVELVAAERALELDADYRQLVGIRSQQTKDQTALEQLKGSVEESKGRTDQCKVALKAAREKYDQAQSDHRKVLPLLQEVRELDLSIRERRRRMEDLETEKQTLTKDRNKNQEKRKELTKQLEDSTEALEEIKDTMEQRKSDAKLVEDLGILKTNSRTLRLAIRERDRIESDYTDSCNEVERLLVIRNEEFEKASVTTRNHSQAQAKMERKQEEIEEVREGHELSYWLDRRTQLDDTLNTLGLVKKIVRAREDVESLDEHSNTLSETKTEFKQTTNELRNSKVQLDSEKELLDLELRAVRKIENLEAERLHLVDGQPCPLCGSEDHPYAMHATPISEETVLKLDSIRDDLEVVTKKLEDSSHQVTRLETELQNVGRQQEELRISIHTNKQKLDNTSALPESISPTKDSTDEIVEKIQEFTRERNGVEEIIKYSQQEQEVLSDLREELQQCSERMNEAKQGSQLAESQHKHAMTTSQRLEQQLNEKRSLADELLEGLRSQFRVYGFESVSETEIESKVSQLSSRRKQWESNRQRKIDLEMDMGTFKTKLDATNAVLQDAENRLFEQTRKVALVSQEIEELVRERCDKLGDGEPDEEEATLRDAIKNAENRSNAALQEFTDANSLLVEHTARVSDLTEAIQNRVEPLRLGENDFRNRLANSRFTDEEDYLSACLPEEERTELRSEYEDLDTNFVAVDSALTTKSRELNEKLEEELPTESLKELQDRKIELSSQIEELQQAVGGLKQRLDDNEAQKQKLQEWNQKAKKQRRECRKWDLLNQFIGSADGKKFREFAQGITFESLIGHANIELKRLSDRYLLIRGEEKPLDLQVVDKYQAGVVRPTSNLSGGESFIVSLALALGLSHMASRNVQLDSLFLDEGFGTLDEDTLSEALAVLGSLQQDGKLIGVISHVPALKERIFTQIHVIAGSSGRSVLSGPGCSRVTRGSEA